MNRRGFFGRMTAAALALVSIKAAKDKPVYGIPYHVLPNSIIHKNWRNYTFEYVAPPKELFAYMTGNLDVMGGLCDRSALS